MNHIIHRLPFPLVLLSLVACTTSGPPSATAVSLFASVQPPAASATPENSASNPAASAASMPPSPTSSGFSVAVIVDTASEHVTREQAGALIAEASGYLTEFSSKGLEMTDFVEDAGGGDLNTLATRYVNEHAASLPNGIVVFSVMGRQQAEASGGFGFTVPGPAGFRNAFISPTVGEGQVYAAVVDYGYKYMPCGYGGSDQVQSAASLAGECRGQTGLACVPSNGYSMCSDAVGHLYTTTRTHAAASMIVHGLLHSFGPGGEQDNYSSPECSTHMGYPAGFFDLQQSQYYNGLCPFVYEEFTKSYHP